MHTESQLVIPAICVIRDQGGICDTSDLISLLKNILPLDGEDLEILPSGFFSRIDQIIRNLKSNKTLLKMGLAEHYDGGFILTDRGMKMAPADMEKHTTKYYEDEKAKSSNTTSVQKTMSVYIKKVGVTFGDSMKAAKTIRKSLTKLPKYKNDFDRMVGVSQVVDDYITNNPNNVLS